MGISRNVPHANAANAPQCRQATAVQHRGVTSNALNRRFAVNLSGARPRHWKSEVLSIFFENNAKFLKASRPGRPNAPHWDPKVDCYFFIIALFGTAKEHQEKFLAPTAKLIESHPNELLLFDLLHDRL